MNKDRPSTASQMKLFTPLHSLEEMPVTVCKNFSIINLLRLLNLTITQKLKINRENQSSPRKQD